MSKMSNRHSLATLLHLVVNSILRYVKNRAIGLMR